MAMQGRKLSAASMELSSACTSVRRRLQSALEEAVEHLAAYA